MIQTVDTKSVKKNPYYVYPVMDVNLPITCQDRDLEVITHLAMVFL